MSVRTKDELLASVRAIVGEDTSDATLELFDDIADTLDNYSNSENIDYKEKYEQNDREWRQKYRDRFMNGKPDDDDDEPEDNSGKKYTYENLFKEG